MARTLLPLLLSIAGACAPCDGPHEPLDGHSQSAGDPQPERAAKDPRPPPTVRPLPAEVMRGVCYAHAYQRGGERGYGSEVSRETLHDLHGHGVRWVSLTPFGFLGSLQDHAIRAAGSVGAGETDQRLVAEIAAARAAGISVMLKPHLWVRGGEWCANLDPAAGWEAFFASYAEWMRHYAELAAAHGVPWLVIGTELRSSLGHERQWRQLIAELRSVYDGALIYAGNWDAVESVGFWDALDAIGVQFYPPLADHPGDGVTTLVARMDARLDGLETLSARVDRPVIFTEVGYRSVVGAAVRPHEWTEHTADARLDLEAQRTCYGVFFAGIRERPWVRGVFPWKWFTDPQSAEEGPTGFSPAGKPAADILRTAYGGADP